MANVKRAALVKARERRTAVDRDRQARDSRVEQAAARVVLGVQQRESAARAMHDANVGIGTALLELLAERIALQDAAELCDLDICEVRRLLRLPGVAVAGQAQLGATASVDGDAATASRGEAGPATVTQLRRRPSAADVDEAAVAVSVPVDGEAAGAARRAE